MRVDPFARAMIQTTDATQAVLWSEVVQTDERFSLFGLLQGTNTSDVAEGVNATVQASGYNKAGTLTVEDCITSGLPVGGPPWCAEMTGSGTTLQLSVTGEAGKTVDWSFVGFVLVGPQ